MFVYSVFITCFTVIENASHKLQLEDNEPDVDLVTVVKISEKDHEALTRTAPLPPGPVALYNACSESLMKQFESAEGVDDETFKTMKLYRALPHSLKLLMSGLRVAVLPSMYDQCL